jgi:histidine ammonia-lyase
VRKLVRADVAHMDDDRYMAPDIGKAAALVRSGSVAKATAVALPEAWS